MAQDKSSLQRQQPVGLKLTNANQTPITPKIKAAGQLLSSCPAVD